MLKKIKSIFRKEPANSIKTKVFDEFYVEHTITRANRVDSKDVVTVEKVLQTRPEIVERATKAIQTQDKEELAKALAKPFKSIPEQEPFIILESAKLDDTDFFKLVLGAVEKPDDKREQIFGLVAVHGSMSVLNKILGNEPPKSNAVIDILSEIFSNGRNEVIELFFDNYKVRFTSFEKALIREKNNSKRNTLLESIQANDVVNDVEKDTQRYAVMNNKGLNTDLILEIVEKYQSKDAKLNTGRQSTIDKRKEHSIKPDYLKL